MLVSFRPSQKLQVLALHYSNHLDRVDVGGGCLMNSEIDIWLFSNQFHGGALPDIVTRQRNNDPLLVVGLKMLVVLHVVSVDMHIQYGLQRVL